MAEQTWSIAEPQKLAFESPVKRLRVRILDGTVNVVGTDEGPARLEVSEVDGPPLHIVQTGDTLTVSYEDLPWNGSQGLREWFDSKPWDNWRSASGRKAWERSAVVTLTLPADAHVQIAAVGAASVVSGIRGGTELHGVSGDATLVRLAGSVLTRTVTGSVEAQSVDGDFRFRSVSGGLTVVDGSAGTVRAESLNGDMLLDLAPAPAAGRPFDISLNSVSGRVAIQLPHQADARVEAGTTSGRISNAFEDLQVSSRVGSKKITGTLGEGTGTLRATTVSGAIALLRRPDAGTAAPLSFDKKVL
ncbi:hypothetical protein DEJ50_22015 [Streptomyces venezuelae]|uniref:DUF4097 domain-containing protein n=1 Tax=Streptomyces venezuelae TaxID=54571 RepID=A0A5P2D5V2_STRVZ|nr:DUF4097 family beta strand repeat-containing protein [Streptomyces venezuelae]QES50103.1 hypothetical protein DEJ50_22015 [Streptomyces venezuelae]